MAILRRLVAVTGWSALSGAVALTVYTRKSHMHDIPDTDYLLGTTLFARYNPNNNPTLKDTCIRKVPLQQIRPELLEKPERLTEAFCGGVFAGWGYEVQRRLLQMKYRGPETASQLWDSDAIRSSSYEVGTVVTDHFEVLTKTENSIIMRSGDTPRNNAVRADDGLTELTTEIKRDEGVVEFAMKSFIYNGVAVADPTGKPLKPPVGDFLWWLHQKYAQVLVESGVKNCMV